MKMAQVTVELRNLLKSNFELFDFDYQFDDPIMKSNIEESIIEFYYDYEIGQETPDMFKRKFKARFKQLIGYYNDLHNTTLLTYNPLSNYSISEALEQLANTSNIQDSTTATTSIGYTATAASDKADSTVTQNNTRTDNTTSANNGTVSTLSNEKNSDYPQQPIAGGDFLNGERVTDTDTTNNSTTTNTGTVTDAATTTNAGTGSTSSTADSEDSGTATGKVTATGTQNTEYMKTIEGLTGLSYQDLVMKERQTLIRITGQIIEELKPCFILVH